MAALRVTTLGLRTFVLVSSKMMIIRWTLEILLRILWLVSTTPYIIYVAYGENFTQMHVHDCMYFCKSFWPGNGSECRFAHKLQTFLGGDTPEPPPCARTQGCSVSMLPLFWLTQLSDSSRTPGVGIILGLRKAAEFYPSYSKPAKSSNKKVYGTVLEFFWFSSGILLTLAERHAVDMAVCSALRFLTWTLTRRFTSSWYQSGRLAPYVTAVTPINRWLIDWLIDRSVEFISLRSCVRLSAFVRDVTDFESDGIRHFLRNLKSFGYLKSDRIGFKILVSVQQK